MTRYEMDRFNDLQLQGFMKMVNPKKPRITAAQRRAEEKARSQRIAENTAAYDAQFAAWFAQDAAAADGK